MRKYLLSLSLSAFFSFLLFLIGKSIDESYTLITSVALFAMFLVLAFILNKKTIEKKDALIYFSLFTIVLLPITYFVDAFYVVDTHIGMFFLAAYFLFKKDLKTTLKTIGFPGELGKTIMYSLAGIFIMLVATILLGIIMTYGLGISDSEKIAEMVASFPVYILLVAIILAPLSEELFFRAFLTGKTGIVVSSVLFAIVHSAYGSIIEIIGTFILGLILAAIYKRSKSITPCIIMHFVYNLISVAVMILVSNQGSLVGT